MSSASAARRLRDQAADYYHEARQLWHDLNTDPTEQAPGWRRDQLDTITALTALSQAASGLAVAVDFENCVPRPIQVTSSAVPFGGSDPVPARRSE